MFSPLVQKILATETLSLDEVFTKRGRVYTFLNPVSYLSALDEKAMFAHFDGIFADGSILVAAIKTVYGRSVTRRSFDMTSLAPDLLSYAETHNKSVYIVASRQDQVEKAVGIFMERYPKLDVVGYRNGYFASEAEMEKEAERIAALNPDFLIVGMGIVMQERFLLKVHGNGYQGVGFTCGGFIHQTAKNEIDYYPVWADKLNLRFVYRMYKEKHTRKRYLQAAFLFPARFICERFFG